MDDACAEGDLLARDAVRVAGAVEPLVVVADRRNRVLEKAEAVDDASALVRMKLFGCEECSEKFATRMPYVSLFCRIQSAAPMTSRVMAMPLSSMTSIETSFEAGAAPA